MSYECFSGLYGSFVKGATLNATNETACSVIWASGSTAASSDENTDGATATAAAAKESKTKSKTKRVKAPATADAEKTAPSPHAKRKKTDTQLSTAASDSAAASLVKAHGSGGLVRLTMQGEKQSFKEHILSAAPRCVRFIVVGGCGAVDVLKQHTEEGERLKHKNIAAMHLHGTLDFKQGENKLPSASGIFHLPNAHQDGPRVILANFGADDLLAGGRGVCEVWGFAFDKKGEMLFL